ncbi:hypothetical protein BEH_25405 (plasmid) [Priestia filamentosa]|jgi:hypothetical protein|uniref:Uncharacterized protein n=1 Tax=Priestia filamentosa TaxID=1402861 RepID=A0A231S0R5_9BACI|nr:hypothetical protein [Priestia filamentosa]AWG44699.1 hypothetical protein BEH_25405 [Priestia filamentosa]OXS64999.1 hypothetical protein B1B01_23825 [Priestia filamentosa]
MSITEIKKMLHNLIEYEDCTIIHTIPGLIELCYCKKSSAFQVTTFADGNVASYYDVETASDALYRALNPGKKEAL